MNKLIKVCLTGGAIYGAMEFSYRFGQGCMLGSIAKYGVNAHDMIAELNKSDKLRLKFISDVAEWNKNKERP